MAVEKMLMMNVIGRIEDVDSVLADIILSEKVELVSAQSQIEANNFVFKLKDENIDKAIDLNYITEFEKDNIYENELKRASELKEMLDIKSDYLKGLSKKKFNQINDNDRFNKIYDKVKNCYDKLNKNKLKLEEIDNIYKSFCKISNIDIDMEDLGNLNYFDFKFGILSKEDRIKLKKNYENILAVIFHTGTSDEGEVYLVLYPCNIEEEMGRILRSLNFKELMVPDEYTNTPKSVEDTLAETKINLEKDIVILEKDLQKHKETYSEDIGFIYNNLKIKERIEELKIYMSKSNKYFYLSGWIGIKDKDYIVDMLSQYKDLLIIFETEGGTTPPTRLKNLKIFKPFEMLVKMYGTPSYDELDPTPFLSLSYMFLFGAMFGDLGQGLVLILGGIFLARKNKMFGGLLSRLGFSSMIFGGLYGAVFGFEDIIPALLIRPFENINTVLAAAVFIGIILILISYIYGLINSAKRKDMEDGLFGKEGVAGLLFYITLLLLIGGKLINKTILSMWIGILIIIICIVAMVFKMPLTHLIKGKRPLHCEDISGYYIESVFSIIETLLSMLSGTVSFIRVGAFALTHVGLFIAFETIGEMIGTTSGNIIVLIIGNIIIIGLEGLIVFIQGLRLQYYELFSRYYKGEGREFKSVKINGGEII
ncbi:V-type ATP synthase subunit I [Tissierella creatinophila]|uniref:V-type ATP synthase subunit I n=1 Tax=Tissierella creatinophila DSM 6911 TaxID=1123403 RepID=A0A1U7M8M8_TISCR|nr:V-type ATPase 116kDa subunit family protein [Tissierella creatinophila]OLS03636.1 V-type ATP synthase subunit I [Tissierella creatinophila DSM 6911]